MNQNQSEFRKKNEWGGNLLAPPGRVPTRQNDQEKNRTDVSTWSAGVARGESPWLIGVGGTVVWSDAPIEGKESCEQRENDTFLFLATQGNQPGEDDQREERPWQPQVGEGKQHTAHKTIRLMPLHCTPGGPPKGVVKGLLKGRVGGWKHWTQNSPQRRGNVAGKTSDHHHLESWNNNRDAQDFKEVTLGFTTCVSRVDHRPRTNPLQTRMRSGSHSESQRRVDFYNQFPLSP